MKALVLVSRGRLLYTTDHPLPLAPDERPAALIRVAAAGICGSDLPRAFDGKAYHYPLVMGHEFSGVVEQPAAGGHLPASTRVAVFPLIPRNVSSDPACQTGDYAQAAEYDYYGSRRDGAFADYVRVPEANLIPVPDHVPLLHAAMTEPAAVALHGVRKLRVSPGDDAAVFGGGPIGNLCAQWLRIAGASRVFVVDVDSFKLNLASSMGFEPINGGTHDAAEMILQATGGVGVQRCIEAVGLPRTFLQATRVCARFGEVVFMGNISGEFSIGEKEFSSILRRELTIYGTWNSKVTPIGSDDWTTALKYLGRGIQIEPLITDRLPLSAGPDIFAELRDRRENHNKVMFEITPEEAKV